MNWWIFILFLGVLQVLCLWFGKKFSLEEGGAEGYFLGGRSTGFWLLTMTLVATQIGGGLFLGSAEEAYLFGGYVLFYPLGHALGCILLGSGIGAAFAKKGLPTAADIFAKVYSSSSLQKVASAISIFSLFLILVAQVIATIKFFHSIGVDSLAFIVILWTTVIFYTVQGGFKAVVATDAVQACFFILSFVIGFFVWYSHSGQDFFINTTAASTPFVAPDSLTVTSWLFSPLLFSPIEQDMVQRCVASVNSKTLAKAAWTSGIVIFLMGFIPIFLGMHAQQAALEVLPGQSVLMTVFLKATPPWVVSLVAVSILVAIFSTATSLINAIASNISFDLLHETLSSKKNDISRKISLAVALLAFTCALGLDQILSLMIFAYGFSIASLAVPILLGLFFVRLPHYVAWSAMGVGVMVYLTLFFLPQESINSFLYLPKELWGTLASLFAAAIAYGMHYFGTHLKD